MLKCLLCAILIWGNRDEKDRLKTYGCGELYGVRRSGGRQQFCAAAVFDLSGAVRDRAFKNNRAHHRELLYSDLRRFDGGAVR